MRRIAIGLILVLAGTVQLSAQTPLEKLEERVKDALDPRNDPRTKLAEPGYLGLMVDDHDEHGLGVRIVDLSAGGPAEKSGLKIGDLVTTIDDTPVLTMQEFARVVERSPPGAKLTMTLVRGMKPERLEVTVGSRTRQPADTPAVAKPAAQGPRPGLLGIRMDVVSPAAQRSLNLPSARGALVVAVADHSPAQQAGIPVDAVIVAVDGQRIDTPAELAQRVNDAGAGKTINVAYLSGGLLVERKVTLAGTAAAPGTPGATSTPTGAAQMQTLVITPGHQFSGEQEQRIRELEARVQELERRIGEMQRLLQGGLSPAPTPKAAEPAPEAKSEAPAEPVPSPPSDP